MIARKLPDQSIPCVAPASTWASSADPCLLQEAIGVAAWARSRCPAA